MSTHGMGEEHRESEASNSSRSTPTARRRKVLAGLAGGVSLTTLAGCSGGSGGDSGGDSSGGSGGDSSGGGSDQSDSGSTTGSSRDKKTLKIGASAALTGQYSQSGITMSEGYKLWVRDLNESGGALDGSEGSGILGYDDVELVLYDDRSDPNRALRLYRRLINEDEVDLLLGPYSSAISHAVLPVVEDAQIPCIMANMANPSPLKQDNYDYIFQATAVLSTHMHGAVQVAESNGASTAAFLVENSAYPAGLADAAASFAGEKGLDVVYNETYPTDVSDFSSNLNKLKDMDVDLFVGGGYAQDGVALTKAAKSVDFRVGLFSGITGVMSPNYRESVGESVNAQCGINWWAPYFDNPYSDQFIDEITSFMPDKYPDAPSIDSHVCNGWHTGLLYETVIKNVGAIDQDAIAEELRTIELRGELPWANGSYKVDDQGINQVTRPAFGQWQSSDGEFGRENIWPDPIATADPIYPHPGWE